MILRVWQFRPHPDRLSEFRSVYGPNGPWALLFAQSSGFFGTELARSTLDPNLYLTIDRWDEASSWELFRRTHSNEYEALNKQCEELTLEETEIGTFRSPAH